MKRDSHKSHAPAPAGVVARKKDGLSHTRGHKKCPACIGSNVLLVSSDKNIAREKFEPAASIWMAHRRNSFLKDTTHFMNEYYIRQLAKFFGPMRLCDINAGNMREYQDARRRNCLILDNKETHPWKHAAGNSIVNHELCCLAQILEHAKLWGKIRPYYFPLPTKKWSPREILNEEDEQQLFSIAASHPEAQLAYWVACITNNTTAAGCELRGLRLKHIFLREGKDISEIYIPEDAVKNDSRPRKIALNRTAKWAVEQCYKRALRVGCCQPDHYLFPFRINRKTWDPSRPGSRWFLRKSWEKLREATGFTNLKPHDLRHQCITRMLERGVDPETVRAIAGHVTEQMMQYYSHIRIQAKHAAVMAIELSERDQAKPGLRAMRRSA